jgi:hypothetical protein
MSVLKDGPKRAKGKITKTLNANTGKAFIYEGYLSSTV